MNPVHGTRHFHSFNAACSNHLLRLFLRSYDAEHGGGVKVQDERGREVMLRIELAERIDIDANANRHLLVEATRITLARNVKRWAVTDGSLKEGYPRTRA